MSGPVIDPLADDLRALREVQAPQQISPSEVDPGGYRVSSAAFMPGTDGTVSIDLEEVLLRHGKGPTSKFPSLPRAVALVAQKIGAIRSAGATVSHVPLAENYYHGEMRSAGMGRKQVRKLARHLAETCEILSDIDLDEVKRLSDSPAH